MLTTQQLKAEYERGLAYDDYVRTGNPAQQEAWAAFHAGVSLSTPQSQLLAGFTRQLHALVVSGVWCGDCVQQCPILDHIANATNGKLSVRFVDRDAHAELADQLRICSGTRVPVCLLLNEDFDFLALAGDRTLSRYRAMAASQLGPSCPLPGAPVPPEEVAAAVQDWADAVERAHLICRLSAKLRQRHED